MQIRLEFPFKLISKDNERIQNRQGRYFLSSKYRSFEEKVRLLATMQYRDKPLEGNLKVTILAGFKDKRHSDCSNLGKGALDALGKNLIYKDDRQIKDFQCIVMDNEPRDSFIVTIEEIK
jgi:Holliday junction resolvase RusA-like endonuclease